MHVRHTLHTLPRRLPALDGLRAVAALGIIATHVSFQTGTGWGLAERLDFLVAVFFALSAFVLWRRRDRHTPRAYALARIRRVMPGYWACVLAVLVFLPGAGFDWQQVVANLTATQIYWPAGLAPGLTHLWSLCVEFSFYIALPFLRRARPGWIVAVALASLAWGWAAVPLGEWTGVNAQIWPPAYTSWFAVGMLAAEAEGRIRPPQRLWPWWLAAAAILWVASREWFGPRGLVHPAPHEFALRIVAGAAFAACIVVPYALGARSRLLESPVFQRLGQWSYGIFLWHVAVLEVAFPLTGIELFSGRAGDFWVILIVTVALTIPVAAASYFWVEAPSAAAIKKLVSQKSPA